MAVTAYPVILVDSTNGAKSDTACSGAGPTTALTGTAGATDVGGTTVTLDAGTNLTNVATDGSHVIYYADATAGHRRFAAINAKAGSGGATPTVGVEQALTGSLSGKSWAIGGVRATIGGTVSQLLINNNGTNGDLMPGWVEEMQSGHTETIAAQVDIYRSGSDTVGPCILRGKSGAATMPIVTFSNNSLCIAQRGSYWQFRDFELQNSNATKTASTAFWPASVGQNIVYSGMKIKDSTNKFWKAIPINDGCMIIGCEIANTASDGIFLGTFNGCFIASNYIHNCGGIGINCSTADWLRVVIINNVIAANTSHGIVMDANGTNPNRGPIIARNTIDSNGGDGIRTAQASLAIACANWYNNILSNNTGYGINFTSGTVTAVWLQTYNTFLDGNDTYNNTSGASNPANVLTNNPALNPTYTGGGNYTPGNTSLKGTAFPMVLPTGTGTNYGYPGAISPNSSGSAGMLYRTGGG